MNFMPKRIPLPDDHDQGEVDRSIRTVLHLTERVELFLNSRYFKTTGRNTILSSGLSGVATKSVIDCNGKVGLKLSDAMI